MEREFINSTKIKILHTLSTYDERLEWEPVVEKYLKGCDLDNILKINPFCGLLKENEKKEGKVIYQNYAEIHDYAEYYMRVFVDSQSLEWFWLDLYGT